MAGKGKRDPRRETLLARGVRMLDLPADAACALPRLELTGDRDLYLEHYRGVLAYGREEIHVDGGRWILRIRGAGLEIRAMRAGELRVGGRIDGLELI